MEINYREILADDESLAVFLKNMKKFDEIFCESMATKHEYSIKLEIHGNSGRMIHCKVSYTSCDRPKSTQKAIQKESE